MKIVNTSPYRLAVITALGTALLLPWVIGAVGLIGVEGDPFDLIYGGVLAVGIIGAIVARLRPRGMARALFATALAQALVVVIALIVGKQHVAVSSVPEIVLIQRVLRRAVAWIGLAVQACRAGVTTRGGKHPVIRQCFCLAYLYYSI